MDNNGAVAMGAELEICVEEARQLLSEVRWKVSYERLPSLPLMLARALTGTCAFLHSPVHDSQAIAFPRHISPQAHTDAPGHLQELPFSKTQAESNVAELFRTQVFGPSAGFRPVGAQAAPSGLLPQRSHCVALETGGPGGVIGRLRQHVHSHVFVPVSHPAGPQI